MLGAGFKPVERYLVPLVGSTPTGFRQSIPMLRPGCLLLAAALLAQLPALAQDYTTWRDYGGTADSAQYSALKQIDRSNVNHLEVAWTYPTGDGQKYLFNPIMVNGVLYVLAKRNSIVALDARTGKEIWTYTPDPRATIITNRGINYWEAKDHTGGRLLFSANHALQAIDAKTGKPILSFGNGGRVDLKEGLGRDPKSFTLVQSTTPGRVFENLLILGSATNQGYGSAPGDIRAFDVLTGKLVWSFHTIPHPGEFGYDTWPPDAWKTVGGANVWSEFSLDEARGIVYAPTASAKYNFYGADRKGADLFADCLLALDARTGKRIWHFQMVHHDIWDYDDATAPKLLRVRHDGKTIDAVALVSKQGFVWVFDRVSGAPLWPIEERPVPRCGHARRAGLAHAAVSHQTAAFRAPEIHRRRSESLHRSAGPRAFPRRNFERPQRRPIHAAGTSANYPDARQ